MEIDIFQDSFLIDISNNIPLISIFNKFIKLHPEFYQQNINQKIVITENEDVCIIYKEPLEFTDKIHNVSGHIITDYEIISLPNSTKKEEYKFHIWVNKNNSDKDIKSTNLGLSYTVGQITLSGQHVRTVGLQSGHNQAVAAFATDGALGEELTGKSVGLAYAASKDLSFGLTYAKADSDATLSVNTEKTVIASVGYSLGAIGVKAQYASVSDYAGLEGNDGKTAKILMFTSF
jgi:hypothetical protein